MTKYSDLYNEAREKLDDEQFGELVQMIFGMLEGSGNPTFYFCIDQFIKKLEKGPD